MIDKFFAVFLFSFFFLLLCSPLRLAGKRYPAVSRSFIWQIWSVASQRVRACPPARGQVGVYLLFSPFSMYLDKPLILLSIIRLVRSIYMWNQVLRPNMWNEDI